VTATPGQDSCGCPETDGKIYHQRGTCTDPVAARLDWYADGPAPAAAATPGQAAYETVYGDVSLLGSMWHDLEPSQRERWEAAAQAAIAAQEPHAAPDVTRLRAELDEEQGYRSELTNDILLNAPESFDGDEAADVIAVRYVRHLEAEIAEHAEPKPAPELAAAMRETRTVREGLDAIRDLCEARMRIVGMVDGKGVARKVIAIIDKLEGK
jgi:hypothetical protein